MAFERHWPYARPTQHLAFTMIAAIAVAFFSASQDIVIDAYRTEIIDDEGELGAGEQAHDGPGHDVRRAVPPR